MSETKFEAEPPKRGTRVSIISGKPPRPYVVQAWKDGQIVEERACQTRDEAEQLQLVFAKRLR